MPARHHTAPPGAGLGRVPASTCNVISAAKEEWHPMTVKPVVEARA
jgi:hypothetical protein